MSGNFGTSHRQLVNDTNAGNVAPVARESAASNAQITPQLKEVIGEEGRLANALLDSAETAAKPYIAEQQRQAERDAYESAGTEEGRQAADAAADVWHNKLFGANASLRGSQERIAEDNARNLYLAAQDLLENGGADAWDDDQWKEWKDGYIEDEVNKYDSEEMRNSVNTSMSKDFQKLERDRGYLHNQYLQQESRNTALNSLNTVAKTYNTDRASSNPNRSEADAAERMAEIAEIKEKSGMSDKAFASAVAQIASEEYSKGRDDFGKFAEANGYFDELDHEDRETLSSAQRIHDIKHDEKFGDLSNEIFGPMGHIAAGNETKALEAYDALVAEYPEMIPPGGRNQIRDQVQQQAWANAEAARVQQERTAIGKHNASTGNWAPQITYDQWGNQTGYKAFSQDEKLAFSQMYIAEELENKEHANREKADPNYERVPLTPQERQQNYANNSQFVGQVMQQNGVMLPEVSQLSNSIMSSINHGLEGMEDPTQLKADLDALNAMYNGNPSVRNMMSEQMGPEFGRMEYVRNQLAAGKSPQEIEKQLAEGRDQQQQGITGPGGVGGAQTYEPSKSDVKDIMKESKDLLGEGGFLIFGKLENDDDIARMADQYMQEELAALGGGTNASNIAAAKSNAAARISREGAIVKTKHGKEFITGAGRAEEELKEIGYEGLDHYLDEMGQNEVYVQGLRDRSGAKLNAWMPWNNNLTNDGVSIRGLEDGRLQLVIPGDPKTGRETYTEYIDLPSEEQVPREMQIAAERTEAAMGIVDKPEMWKDLTGKNTPREIMDRDLSYKYANKNGLLTGANQAEQNEIINNVTQDQRDTMLHPNLYNNALIERQQLAAEKEVSNIARQEKIASPMQAALNTTPLYRGSKTALGALQQRDRNKRAKNLPPPVNFYRQGEDRETAQERHAQEMQMWREQQEAIRDAEIESRR